MIRSRDFFLFVVVLVFISVGIGITVIRDMVYDWSHTVTSAVSFNDTEPYATDAWIDESEIDRASNIAKFKEKIAAGEGLSAGPAVLTYVDEDQASTTALPARTPNRCSNYDPAPAYAATWPQFGVTISFVEGAYVAKVAEVSNVANGTGTVPTMTERTLAALPAATTRNNTDTCLDSAIVGIDTNGKLIRNNDTSRYAAYSEFSLVGYARDGFPIYGFKKDVSGLDTCGGTQEATGYRYYLRDQEDFILGCFAGTPARIK